MCEWWCCWAKGPASLSVSGDKRTAQRVFELGRGARSGWPCRWPVDGAESRILLVRMRLPQSRQTLETGLGVGR